MIYPVYVVMGKKQVLLTIAKSYRQAIAIKKRYEDTSYRKIIIAKEVA